MYKRWIEDLWSGRSVAAELVSDDFVGHWPGRDVCGPAELQQIIEQTRNMFDGIEFRIELGPSSTATSSRAGGWATAAAATAT